MKSKSPVNLLPSPFLTQRTAKYSDTMGRDPDEVYLEPLAQTYGPVLA